MKLLVSALISKFGNDEYNVTMLYGDANSNMIPVFAPEIQTPAITEMACDFTRELAQSNVKISPKETHLYNIQTTGSMCSAATIASTSNMQDGSDKWILATLDRIGTDELNALIDEIRNLLTDPAFCGKFEYCNSFVRMKFETS